MAVENKYSIIKVDSIMKVLDVPGDIYLFDIEQTILKENRFFEAISRKFKNYDDKNYYSILLGKLCRSLNIVRYESLISYGKHYKRELVEEKVKDVIRILKQNGKKVYALTSGYPNMDKFLKMEKEHGISFDHVICTSRGAKGPALLQHVTRFNINETCVFVDNHESKLKNVGDTFANNNRIDQLKLLHYTFYDRYIAPDKESFIKYWTNAIRDLRLYEYKI